MRSIELVSRFVVTDRLVLGLQLVFRRRFNEHDLATISLFDLESKCELLVGRPEDWLIVSVRFGSLSIPQIRRIEYGFPCLGNEADLMIAPLDLPSILGLSIRVRIARYPCLGSSASFASWKERLGLHFHRLNF